MIMPRCICPAIVCIAFGGCNLSESPFIQACEAALKDTLVAPSTYRRIAVTETKEAIPLDDYHDDRNESVAVRRFERQQGLQPVRVLAMFEYEAANRFGTPLRLFTECSYDTSSDDASGASEHNVRIDGQTKTDRLIEAVERLQRDGSKRY